MMDNRRALFVYTATALALFGPTLFSECHVLSQLGEDMTNQYYHWRVFLKRAVTEGYFPTWMPHIFGGVPYFAGMQSAMLYPVTWLHFTPLSTATAINLEFTLHLVIASYFTFLLAKQLGASGLGALASGVGYSLSGPYFLHIYAGHLSNTATMAWAPAVFLFIEKKSFVWLSLAILMQILAGHFQYAYFTGIAVGLYLLVRASTKQWAMTAAAYVLAGAMAAAQLLPTYYAKLESAREATSISFAASFFFPYEQLTSAIFPFYHGGINHTFLGMFNMWETNIFVGLFTLIAAVTVRSCLWCITLFLLLVAFGVHNPIFGPDLYLWVYKNVPLMDSLRGIAKFVFLPALFVAVLAGIGVRKSRWLALFIILEHVVFAHYATASFDVDAYLKRISATHQPSEGRSIDTALHPNTAIYFKDYSTWGEDPFVTQGWSAAVARGDPLTTRREFVTDGGRIDVLTETSDTVDIYVSLPKEGTVIFTAAHAKGWALAVDGGAEIPSHSVRGFRSFTMPEGRYFATMYYNPPGLLAGSAISFLAVIIWGFLWVRY